MHPNNPNYSNSGNGKNKRVWIALSCAFLAFVIIATFFTIKTFMIDSTEHRLGTVRVWYTEMMLGAQPRPDGSISDDMLISQGKFSELILLPSGYDALEAMMGTQEFSLLVANKKDNRFGEPIVDWGEATEGRYLLIDNQEESSALFDALCQHMRFANLEGDACQFEQKRVESGQVKARAGTNKPLIAKIRVMNLAPS